MTALEQYQRLESTAVWRESRSDQRQEAMVALGEASLVIADKAGRPLAHWSLPAVVRRNPGDLPAVFSPGIDGEEELEIEDEAMINGIETVHSALSKRRSRPGRLRSWGVLATIAALVLLTVFWLPNAMQRYTASVVPEAKRVEIGKAVLEHVFRITGGECTARRPALALDRLRARLGLPLATRIAVLAGGSIETAHIPGGLILVNRILVEDHEIPEVVAGYVLAEHVRSKSGDPLLQLLEEAGIFATFRLLTTGQIPALALKRFGENLMVQKSRPIGDAQIVANFTRARIPTSPYAYAIDITGETTVQLLESDPFSEASAPAVLSDADWISLQEICGE